MALAGCGAPPPVGHASAAIVDGVDDDGDPAVVGLVFADHIACTGVVVAPRAVVTAAHCLDDTSDLPTVLVGASAANASAYRAGVVAWLPHPAYDASRVDGADLGVLVLGDDVAAPPLGLDGDDLDAAAIGVGVRIVGFGHTGPDGLGDHVKRASSAVLSAVDARTFTTTPAPGQACDGDSGGPALLPGDRGERWVGVVSRGRASCDDDVVYTRLAPYADDFVRPALALAATQATPASDGVFGSPCVVAAQCASGICARTSPAGPRRCSAHCAPSGPDCAVGDCVVDDDSLAASPRWACAPAAGCAVGRSGGGAGDALALVVLLFVVRRRWPTFC